jgi:hypothetical protein
LCAGERTVHVIALEGLFTPLVVHDSVILAPSFVRPLHGDVNRPVS